MSRGRKASGGSIWLAVVVLLLGCGGVFFFMTAEAMQWLTTWVALSGIVVSIGVIIAGGLWANRKDPDEADKKE